MSDQDIQAAEAESRADFGPGSAGAAKRWKAELHRAEKREEKWLKAAKRVLDLYVPENPAENSFNVLWPNTETMRQAIYNSLPQPQVRRRYQDEDKLGRAVSEVLGRALEFSQETYDFDAVLKGDVLGMLLPGRAVSRVLYVPSIKEVGNDADDEGADDEYAEQNEDDAAPEGERQHGDLEEEPAHEEIEWEQALCVRVPYRDFRMGKADAWDEMPWVGFRHRFNRDDCIEKFGQDIGEKVPLNDDAESTDSTEERETAQLFKVGDVWEIWEKETNKVFWVSTTYPEVLKAQDAPMKFTGFFPCPRPLYAIENVDSMVPTPLYTQYEQQARELNRLCARINKIIAAIKVRGLYDATIKEMDDLSTADDNTLIAAEKARELIERGGLEKAIWMMPIEVAAAVLKELQAQRDATKQIIYEITGIADIMRAATDPNETYGAQKLKSNWGSQRLQRMQAEVKRYTRDLVRLKGEVIAQRFQPATLAEMTNIKLPHEEEIRQQYEMAMMQWQHDAQAAQQQGQQPPPRPQPPDNVVTWEAVLQELRSPTMRAYRIDIETDSTLLETQDSDMEGLERLLGGITKLIAGLGPAVEAGAIPIEAVKQIVMVACRRGKMGSAVEDAFDKMQAPPPKPDPEAAKAQAEAQQQQQQQAHEQQLEQMKATFAQQTEQVKAQANAQAEAARAQADQQVESVRAQASIAIEHAKSESAAQVDAMKRNHELTVHQMKLDAEAHASVQEKAFEEWKAKLEAMTKIAVAEIAAQAKADALDAAEAKANKTIEES